MHLLYICKKQERYSTKLC